MPTFPRTADAESGFPPLNTGWYRLRVLDVRDKTDKNGADYFAVQFEVDGGPKQVWDNFRKSEDWLWKLKALLECINPDLTEKEFEHTEIVGEEVMAFITPDGKYDRIKQYANKDESQPTVPSEEKDDDLPF
ncbi:MAG: hypothetical protein IMF11_20290 [Proteobacteria bacterium]|nr:hypothetical protein [Pseudomonadota bacterium]